MSTILAQGDSNHCPIESEIDPLEDLGLVQFHYNTRWLQEEGVVDLIKQVWIILVSGSPTYVWEIKLRAIAKKITKVNFVFGDSMIVICQVWKARRSQNSSLPPILQRIVLQLLQF